MKKTLFIACLILVASITGFTQNVIKQCTPGGFYYSCGATTAHQSEQGPWFDLVINGNQNSWYQGYGIESMSWKEYDNGTAKLTGRLYQIINKANVKFDVNLTFSSKGANTPHGGGDGWHCLPTSTSDWYYYNAMSGTINGVVGTHVGGVNFTASLVTGTALQIGTGGSTNSKTKYGMSAWLNLTQTSGWNTCWKKGGADLYFDLNNCVTTPPPPTCSNFTSGGTICCDQSGCAPFDPTTINNTVLPSGGSGTTEYVWLKSTTASTLTTTNASQWQQIAGATGHSYDPGSISQTTWFIRCARRSGCTDYVGESNVVKMTVTAPCVTPPTTCTVRTVSNAQAICNSNVYGFWYNSQYYTVGNGTTFTENTNGTANLAGTFVKAGETVTANVTFSGRTSTAPINSPKYENCINSGGNSWYYYTSFSGTLQFSTGSTVAISHYGPAFQIGYGANLNDNSFGAAAWFQNSAGVHLGDFNFRLSETGTACSTCNNLTSGGQIGSDQNACSPYTSTGINNMTLPSGGDATKAIEYVWLKTTDPLGTTNLPTCDANGVVNLKSWVEIAGSNSSSYNPGVVNQTTWYLRCARRAGCVCYYGESNIVKITITGACPTTCIGYSAPTTILHYNMNACSAGSSFTEFTPAINKGCLASATGTVFSSLYGSHSCNPGFSSLAICAQSSTVSTYSSTVYSRAFTFNTTLTPVSGQSAKLNSLTFYQRSTNPAYFSNGTTQSNNRLTKFAVRIKNGTTVVFEQKDIAVSSTSWGLSTIDLSNTAGLVFSSAKTYTVEIAAYAPAWVGSTNYIFDIDELKLNASCSINASFTASISGNTTICSGQNSTLSASPSGIGYSYKWSNGATNQNITVGAGIYTVTITNSNGCTAVASKTVTTSPTPTVSITGNLSVCSGQTTTLTAQGGGTYAWSNGATTQSITVGAGNYSVTVTNATCSATASATVNTVAAPSVNITGNLSVCNNGTTTLTATGGGSYSWSNGSTSASINVSAGTYTVVVTNSAGCTASKTVTVTNAQFTTSITGNLSVCTGKTTTLTAQGGGTYAWSNGATTQSITVGAGTYGVTVTNGTCSATASATVNTVAAPTVNITGNLSVCNNGTTTLTATGGGTYSWSNGSTSASINVSAGTYTVVVTNSAGCTASKTVTVTNAQFTTSITGNLSVCAGQTTILTAQGNGTYAWSNGATTQSITVGAGTYGVTVTNGTCSATASATVNTSAAPTVNITGNLSVCNNGTTTLTATGGGTYAWSNGTTSSSITVNAGTYTVVVTNSAGCTASKTVTVTNSNVTASITGNTTICTGATTTLTAAGGSSYKWSNGATSASITVTAGAYTVTVTNAAGCTDIASKTVVANNCNTSSVGDFVFCDKNGNGIQDAGEPGIAGVTVTLTGTDVNGNPVTLTTTTDANGSYLFTNLAAGTYKVTFANPNGYVVTSQDKGGNDATDSDINSTGMTPTFMLGVGQSNTTIDAGFYQPASLGNFVFNDLDNDGVQDAGEPGIAGVTVSLSGTKGDGALVSLSTTTDANGAYSFTNLAPGTYTVTFGKPTGFNGSLQDQGGNDATDSDANPTTGTTAPVTLTSGQNNTTIDAGFNKPCNIAINITNKVCNNNNTPSNPDDDTYTFTMTVTGGTGTWQGGYDNGFLGTFAFGPTSYNTPIVLGPFPAGKFTSSNTFPPIVVLNGLDINIHVSDVQSPTCSKSTTVVSTGPCSNANSSVGDKVFCDKNGNGIQDSGEPGVSGTTVTLTGTDVNGNPVTLTTTTDANGNYNFPNLAAGTYKVTFVLPASYTFAPQDKGGNDATDSDANPATGMTSTFVLGVNENNTTIDAGAYQPASLGNFVFNDLDNDGVQDAGEPGIAGVTVSLSGTKGDGTLVSLSTTTDVNGAYSFTNLAPGTYTVTFGKPTGFNGSPQDQGGNDATDSDANPTTGATAPVTLTSGQNNTTVDAGFNKPISTTTVGDFVFLDCNKNGIQDAGETGVANVSVSLKNVTTGAIVTTTTNANGIYSFANVAAGSYTITFGTVKNLTFAAKDLGGNDAIDSDANANGTTDVFTVAGFAINTIDAGLQDNIKPVFSGIPVNVTVECSAVPAAVTPTATDNCDASVTVTMLQTKTNGVCADSYTITRTWTASDDCGNTCASSQVITVRDTQKPVISGVPADVTIGCSTTTPPVATPTATDNCDALVTITFAEAMSQVAGTCPKTIIIREWTATDNCGNTSKATQRICLADNEGPVISGVPADVTVLCSAIPAVATGITAVDACSPSVLTVTFGTQTSAIAGAYIIKRTWSATDICGNKTIKTQVICAKDTQKPTFTGVPADVTVECNAIPAATNPIAKDNCDTKMPVTLTEVRIPGACPFSFTIKRTWTVTDDAGNVCSVTQTITVKDTKAPVITGTPADVTIQCGDEIPLPPSVITATDNCSSYVPITFSEIYYQGDCDGKSKILCQWVAKDDCGNTTVKQWNITINGASALINAPNSSRASVKTSEISVFPNPTRDEFNVQFNGQKISRLTIFDMAGRMIQNIDRPLEDNVVLQLGKFTKGVYTIQLHTSNGIIAKRITLLD